MDNEIEPRLPNRQVTEWSGAPCKNGNRVQSGRASRKGRKWRTNAKETQIRPIPTIIF